MHPAFSVIFFTVTSGLGYGLMMLLVFAHLTEFSGALTTNDIMTAGVIALVSITAGLISSTFHLANPKNAWRAMSRFRTSWLAREGLLAVMLYPFALAYLAAVYFELGQAMVMTFGIISALISLLTIYSTGMIYACLKTIRQWNTSLTPVNYIMIGLSLGALMLVAILATTGSLSKNLVGYTADIVFAAAIFKLIYYVWIGKPAGPSINTATGFTNDKVRLFDTGHTAGTFLTHEFGYQIKTCKPMNLRIFSLMFGFVIPAVLMGKMYYDAEPSAVLAYVSLIIAYLGVLLERWLFFAEAKHVVNLYHGMQRT